MLRSQAQGAHQGAHQAALRRPVSRCTGLPRRPPGWSGCRPYPPSRLKLSAPRGSVLPRPIQNPEPGCFRSSSLSAVEARPSVASRCGKRPTPGETPRGERNTIAACATPSRATPSLRRIASVLEQDHVGPTAGLAGALMLPPSARPRPLCGLRALDFPQSRARRQRERRGDEPRCSTPRAACCARQGEVRVTRGAGLCSRHRAGGVDSP